MRDWLWNHNDHTMNTRQVIENLTEDPNSQCYGCHYNYFNGLGFATGHFNALGKCQESELMFTEDFGAFGYSFTD